MVSDAQVLTLINSNHSLTVFSGPGRRVNKGISVVAEALMVRANHLAHLLGLGPDAVAKEITSYFRDRMREQHLRCKTLSMQGRALEHIVRLATSFPGLRSLFLLSEHMKWGSNLSKDAHTISALWDRDDDLANEKWQFWRFFAVVCLSDTIISTILEECPSTLELTKCDAKNSVIERLLIAHEDAANIFSGALCISDVLAWLGPGFIWLGLHKSQARAQARKSGLALA
ncbi:hypothetical protein DFH07DRAFT_770834 [Mycena maculata]|uniref:Uncharacterized protein n=1 Tax=Mycena maculata TaxID=230809 RepID=A0AAD7JF95_9AGAR|nr:hypothetical protein DFH07DRAFT_770834 [Mycena maculata]